MPFDSPVLAIKILFLQQTYKNAAVKRFWSVAFLWSNYFLHSLLLTVNSCNLHLKTEVQTDCFAFDNKLTIKFLKKIVDVINWENFFVHNASGFVIQMETTRIMDIYHCCSSEKNHPQGESNPSPKGLFRTLSLQIWNSNRSRIKWPFTSYWAEIL